MVSNNIQNRSYYLSGWRRYVLVFVFSVLILAFCTLGSTSDGFAAFRKAGANGVLLVTLSFVGVALLLNKFIDIIFTRREGVFYTILQFGLSAIFSLVSVLGVYFEKDKQSGISSMMKTDYAKFSFAAAYLGGLLFFMFIIRLIGRLDTIAQMGKLFYKETLTGFFGKNLFLNCCVVLFLCWLPQYIIRFPGVVTYDNWQSLAMYYGYTETTTQHPLIWNVLLGKLTDLGVAIDIPWFASLFICLLNYILAMLVVSYTICSIKKMGFGKRYLAGVLIFFAILPPMSLYITTTYNDLIFSLAILLLVVELAYYLYDRKNYFTKVHHWIFTALAVFCTILRYNGLYTMLVVIAVVGFRELYLLLKHRVKFTQVVALILLLMIVPLMCGQVLQYTLNQKYDAKPITSRAMLAMPIQQTVRCLIEHGDEIDREDYKAIHNVLTWSDEEYAQSYDPRNFDSVKESFKVDATKGELARFIKAWMGLLIKFPKTCFMATANQTYYLFSPLVRNVRYYVSNSSHASLAEPRYGFDPTPYTFRNEELKKLCKDLVDFNNDIFPTLPVVGLTVSQAMYTILLIAVCMHGLFRKDRRVLVLAVPLLVTLGITFIGPAVFRHPRYIYPIMFSMPVLLAAFMLPEQKNELTEAKS